jgi:hypothetical protein
MACEPSPIARARRPIRQVGHPPTWGSPIARSASDRPTGRRDRNYEPSWGDLQKGERKRGIDVQ